MQKNNLLCGLPRLVAVTCVFWLPIASAAENPVDNVTNGQMEIAQARNMILEQQVQTARLLQQLRQIQSGDNISTGTPNSAPPGDITAGVPSDTPQVSGQSERVRLMEIYGRKGELRARISLPRGGTTEIHKGDVIPGTKQTVTAVTPDVVLLSDGSELTF
ncbi:type IV pilus biogenesis protein PilP [Salmonella enterica subsp. enterica]|nr:type IV pilus biogenesis protein PilP [Salmonella enterica]ECC3308689.1 type IV pilus biogenesis protein PilP [Salmonella enterica subsp. enterica]EDR2818984.1 type IV pilus biogenesis protein PilP [Salmonella enterica subsp. enterica]EEJ9202697.1 type IV pilus biogenesis protein PilP [Salmonella enterica subsp. enterica serovar Newport]EJV0313781.1 type IV pilus biogenesis protein PilP [Salmonella enterica]